MASEHHVLISPLGRSPGAVSGVYFGLQEQEVQINEVITVGTSHEDVWRAAHVWLRPLLAAESELTYRPRFIASEELRGGEQDVGPFTARMGLCIQQARDAGHEVHVAVTGGRSGMGALAALAAQLYGADHLWHLWVERDIERNGTLDRLQPPAARTNVYLNPAERSREAWELVPLPFVDLVPLHGVIRDYLSSGTVPDPDTIPYNLFVRAGVERLAQVFPAGLTIEAADRITNLAAEYHGVETKEKQAALFMEVGCILQNAGVYDEKVARRMRDLVMQTATPEVIRRLVAEAREEDDQGFFRWVSGWLKENEKVFTVPISMGKLLLDVVGVWIKLQALP